MCVNLSFHFHLTVDNNNNNEDCACTSIAGELIFKVIVNVKGMLDL